MITALITNRKPLSHMNDYTVNWVTRTYKLEWNKRREIVKNLPQQNAVVNSSHKQETLVLYCISHHPLGPVQHPHNTGAK